MSDSALPRPVFDTFDPAIAEAMKSGFSMAGIPDYLGIVITEVGPGTLTAELEVRPDLLNPFGSAHGGTLAALVDHVLGAVLYPLIPPGTWAATSELKVNFLAPSREGLMRARSEVIALSKRTAVVRIDVTNDDRLVGAAQGTVTISTPRSHQTSS
jgi:1,4-dihydroxy-2-naphthoyl-CoA hydrolase